MVVAHQLRGSTQLRILEDAWMRHAARNVRQHLAACIVQAERSRRAAEANLFEVAQQVMYGGRPRSSPSTHGRANSLNRAGHVSARQEFSPARQDGSP